MTGNEYQELASRTNDKQASARLSTWLCGNQITDIGCVMNAALGLSGEVGELNDIIKKTIFHGHPMDEGKLKHELGDICWYIVMMCEACGYELEDIMNLNIDKLRKRYPEGFSEEASINRAE